MSDVVSLQPQNATPLMRAVSLTNAERRPIAPADLATLWDPRACPADVLPYLAAAHGVSVWRSDWPEARKRRVIARSIALKSQRGTLPCFEEHLAFIDSALVQAIAPPQRAVALDTWTVEQREAWKAQFPELRVYHYRNRAQLGGLVTSGRWLTARLTPQASQGLRFAGQQAVVVDGGVERSALVKVTSGASEFAQTAQISLPTVGRFCVPGRPGRGFYPQASIARERLFAIRAAARGPDTVRPGLQPLDVAPTRVSAPIAGVVAFPAGEALAGPFRFVCASRAREAVYDSIRLFEPSRVRSGKVRRRAGLTPGFTRLGQPPFQLELAVDLSHQRRKARRFPSMPAFLEEFDPTRTDEALAALRAAKLGRDRILVRTGLHRRIQLGDRVPLNGSFRLGQIIRSL